MLPFTPQSLPLKTLEWEKLIDLISNANREIARYDGILKNIPNQNLLLSPLTTVLILF